MSYKKILTIQDISCVGQCSLTVALPILSACGMETCILPSAILSTHTAGFQDFTLDVYKRQGEYTPPQGYFVDEDEAEEFDKGFSYKEKLKLPGHLF